MADTKITALTALTAADPANDVIPIVDVSDTSMAASGTTKKISVNNILGASGTATLASATITGDLTVRTNKLFVNATGVGIGNTGPLSVLTISSQTDARLSVRTTDATFGSIAGGTAFDSLNDAGNTLVPFGCRGSTVTLGSSAGIGFQIDASGNATWQNVGGVAGTAMTLNSTGLGIGGSPAYKLDVVGPVMRLINSAATADIFITDSGTTNGNVRLRGESNALKFITGGGVSATIDSSGNVGIGVTPSYKLHVAGANPTAAINSTTASISSIATLLYRNVDGNSATQSVASIAGETAGNGGYGNLIFSTGFNGSLVERMRIDLSGNLILQSSATPATLGTNGMLTVNATSNTNLRFSYRGSDGTTRVANLTLA